jgi:amino acid transporter
MAVVDRLLGFEGPAPTDGSSAFDFVGWGTAERIDDLELMPTDARAIEQPHKSSLGVWASTALCGNDITSSCLYVAALTASQAGALAPVALMVVAATLYLFRSIYAEVGSALPLNGGTYTLLLNTTGKKVAAAAAVLTILSYVATAVISAGEAMHYAHNLWAGLPIFWATVGLLGLFAFLNIIGITESAVVAIVIFFVHLGTLTLLSVSCGVAFARDPSLFVANWSTLDGLDFEGFGRALFFGFAAAMLGISGFESSANFIEEQKRGVFPQTLRNMWLAVTVFNPLISLLSLAMLPMAALQAVPEDLLADMGNRSAGAWLGLLVSVDAVLVLSGAVLTSFVGVTGLVRRMSLDRCLPQFLLRENRRRKTNHWIILLFFSICCGILVVTAGNVSILAGVYTISFLSVMACFALGNMILKVKRARLPRQFRASWPAVLVGFVAVAVGLLGNLLLNPQGVGVFLSYASVFGGALLLMFLRIQLLKLLLLFMRSIIERLRLASNWMQNVVGGKIAQILGYPVIYFTRGDNIALLNRCALYVMENEQTNCLKVVHVYNDDSPTPPELAQHLHVIDRLYPDLRIDFVAVKGKFGPEFIDRLSRRLRVPKNYMFIGTPGDKFPHRIEELGGVRVII